MENYYKKLISDLDHIDNNFIDDSDVLILRKKLKQAEAILDERTKPKTITISGQAHGVIKKFCAEYAENIGEWTEKILLKEIENLKGTELSEDEKLNKILSFMFKEKFGEVENAINEVKHIEVPHTIIEYKKEISDMMKKNKEVDDDFEKFKECHIGFTPVTKKEITNF